LEKPRIPKIVFVLSAKGGVGKSTVAAALARWLKSVSEKSSVGLLDCDVTNPSIPHIMGSKGEEFQPSPDLLEPIVVEGVKTASVTYALPGEGLPIIWRGETSREFIYQLLSSVRWGVDYLVVDTPPGVHDETLWLLNAFRRAAGAVLVTSPQELAVANVRRSISFCKDRGIPILGLLENMAFLKCPKCGHEEPLGSGDAELMSAREEVPYCGRLPFLPEVHRGNLEPLIEQPAFQKLGVYVLAFLKEEVSG